MKKLTIFCIGMCTATAGNAQTLSPKVLPTTGNYFSAGGVSLSWTLGETSTLTLQSGAVMLTQGEQQPEVANPLPLTWLSVNGSLNTQNQAVITWKVEEENVSGFVVEKQTTYGSFINIGTINSFGNGTHTYSFTEPTELNGIANYRVKQIDIDGRYTYSKSITLRNNATGKTWVYPNPVESSTRIYVTDVSLINTSAKLIDMHGRVLLQLVVQSGTPVDLSGYARGVYRLQFSNGTNLQLIKM